jgi:hypothetical protein
MRTRKGQVPPGRRSPGTGTPSEKDKRLTDEELDPLDCVFVDSKGDVRDVTSSELTSEVRLVDLITSKPRKRRGMASYAVC